MLIGNPLVWVDHGLAAHSRVFWPRGTYFSTDDHKKGAFTANHTGYIGFRFQHSDNVYNGWLRVGVSFDGDNPVGISLLSKNSSSDIYGAWSTGDIHAGEVVSVAAVPEPAQVATGLGLLALGAAGVREFRRRRMQPQPAATA